MEFTGKLVSDAKSSIVKGHKEVINFTIVQNERYKTKEGEEKQVSTFINIAWWKGPAILKVLKKGAIVTINGRLFCNAYTDISGNIKASINCHANLITVVAYAKAPKPTESKSAETIASLAPAGLSDPLDDLPF